MTRSALDKVRTALSPAARKRVRRFADRFLTSIGSINGARDPTRLVGITFDDGPDPIVTPRLLDLLAKRKCKATFFVLTEKAMAQADIVQRMVSDGHEVALHFDRHDRLTEMPVQVARSRLIAARKSLEELVGPIRFFRPPFGGQSLATYFMARSLGLEIVSWGPYAEDWVEQSPAEAAARALSNMQGGDILLLHDGLEMPPGDVPPTFDRVRMVELILEGMAKAGHVATSVGALVDDGRPRLSPWFRH
jgi:peptidoglycan/xylan/chitin deacetylase (PgdA/CDA1 family)